MTLEEMYRKLGGDYGDVRLRIPSEALIRRFAVKFLSDTTFADLVEAVEAQDWKKAFRAAHNEGRGFEPRVRDALPHGKRINGGFEKS